MKNLFVSLLLLCSVISYSYAQKSDVKAIVQDSLGESIIGASVMLTAKADSTLVGFGLTDDKGFVVINNVEKGEYFLQVTYMGYRSHLEYVKLDGNPKDMGTIVLQEGNTMLEEVVIMEDRIPIIIKKDTIEYNAGSFDTKANATVEDLIKQLPGMEVEEDGTIKAQGKKVEKVLVEGKEFFGDDPTVATKNLPADAVDKVQVYDDKTDEQKFSGDDSGEKVKTMNLKLKEDKKQGYFGKVYAGGGTQKTYNAGFSLNRFSKTKQISIISKFNNINEAGFSMSEYMEFNGGVISFEDNEDGISTLDTSIPVSGFGSDNANNGNKISNIVGLNYGQDFTKKFKLNSSYTFNSLTDTTRTVSKRTNYLTNQDDYLTNGTNYNKNRYFNHSAKLKWTYEIDSTQSLLLKNNVSVSTGDNYNENTSRNSSLNSRLISAAANKNESDKNDYSLNNSLRYRKRFKPGRTLSAYTKFNYAKKNKDSRILSNNDFYDNEENLLKQQNIDRNTQYKGRNTQWSQNVSYTEPLAEALSWRNSAEIARDLFKRDNEVTDRENGTEQTVAELSRDFTFDKWIQRFNTKLSYKKEKYSFGIGGKVERLNLSIEEGGTSLFNKPYWFVLPNANGRLKTGNKGYLYFDYSAQYRLPSYDDLQPLRNNTNPLRITEGNPDLDPEYSHNFSSNYHLFDNFSFTNIFAYANYSITPNSIIRKTSVDPTSLVETTQAVNGGAGHDGSVSISYGRPLNFMKAKLNTKLKMSFANRPFWVNNIKARRQRLSPGFRLTLSNKNKTNWDMSLRYSFNYNKNTTTDTETEDIIYKDQGIRAKVNYFAKKRWGIGTTADYKTYSSTSFNDDNNVLLWTAFAEVNFLKDEKGTLRLSAYDILNQNRGVSRTANSFYTLEEDANNLGRYFLLTFSYKISFFGK